MICRPNKVISSCLERSFPDFFFVEFLALKYCSTISFFLTEFFSCCWLVYVLFSNFSSGKSPSSWKCKAMWEGELLQLLILVLVFFYSSCWWYYIWLLRKHIAPFGKEITNILMKYESSNTHFTTYWWSMNVAWHRTRNVMKTVKL